MGVQDFVEADISVVALVDGCLGLDGLNDGLEVLEVLRGYLRGFVQQDDVAELYLLDDEAGKVLLTDILSLQRVTKTELVTHAKGIDNGDDGVEARLAVLQHLLGNHLGIGGDGLGDRCRLADATGLDDDIVEAAGVDDVVELLDKVHLQCTADTAVLQCHKTVVALAHDTTLLDQRGVDIHLADVVDDDGEADAFLILQYAVQKGCLTAA